MNRELAAGGEKKKENNKKKIKKHLSARQRRCQILVDAIFPLVITEAVTCVRNVLPVSGSGCVCVHLKRKKQQLAPV